MNSPLTFWTARKYSAKLLQDREDFLRDDTFWHFNQTKKRGKKVHKNTRWTLKLVEAAQVAETWELLFSLFGTCCWSLDPKNQTKHKHHTDVQQLNTFRKNCVVGVVRNFNFELKIYSW